MKFSMDWQFIWVLLFLFYESLPSIASNNCKDEIRSACDQGYFYENYNEKKSSNYGNYGYACPHLMMLSDTMTMAAEKDGLSSLDFVYAVAGGGKDEECGKCYQVQVLDAERKWRPDFPFLIVQIVNSGFDVLTNQLDLFMGGGGFGYFTSCNQDCQTNFCKGGPCKEGMYQGTFDQWINAQYDDPNPCYSGGVKWLDELDEFNLLQSCQALSNNQSETLTKSCVTTNEQYFHQNFVSSRRTRIQCPSHLYTLTNLHRSDDIQFPVMSPSLPLDQECKGDRTQGRYCITTMQDCCKHSCSWSNKIESYLLDPSNSCVYTCDRNGDIIP